MSKDIAPILRGWDYEGPERLSVRKIEGLDGRAKIQLRLEMGLVQMEVDGRPDGRRPHGYESVLEYCYALLETHRRRHGSDEGFALNRKLCSELHQESLQYYHRRISCLALGDYDQAERDSKHNLQIMDLLKDYAADQDDWLSMEQWRAYVLMHRTQARALRALDSGDYDAALRHIRHGIAIIQDLFSSYGKPELMEESLEIAALKELQHAILSQKPPTPVDLLHRELEEALSKEDYKRAAQIRDELRRLEEGGTSSGR